MYVYKIWSAIAMPVTNVWGYAWVVVSVAGTCGEMTDVGGESGTNAAGADDTWSGLVGTPGPLPIPGAPSEVDSLGETSGVEELRSH